MKEFWCDVETTGLDPQKNGIWQIAYLIHDGDRDINREFKIQPFPTDEIEDRALEVGGIKRDDLKTFHPAIKVYRALLADLGTIVDKYDQRDKMLFYAYNAAFDNQFLRSFFVKCGDKYFGSWFWFPYLDIMTLAMYYLKDRRSQMPNFKLATVANELGIKIKDENLHNASYDIEITRKILQEIINENFL